MTISRPTDQIASTMPEASIDLTPLADNEVRVYFALDASGNVMGKALDGADEQWSAINSLYVDAQEHGYKWVSRVFRFDKETILEDFTL